MKKIFSFLMVMLMGITLAAGCKKDNDNEKAEMTLEDLNAMLNDKVNMNMDFANTVAIIPFNHINGPRNEWKFYALINFQYAEKRYVKYQVTYLSCTCRTANVNYWQTAYVELSTNVKDPENAKLKALSFDLDGTEHYTAGFWGDSNPIVSASTGKTIATYSEYEEATESISKVKLADNKTYTVVFGDGGVAASLERGDETFKIESNSATVGSTTYTANYDEDVLVSFSAGGTTYNVETKHAGIYNETDEKYYYPTIKNEFINDLLIGKTKAQIDKYNTMDDMVVTSSNPNNVMSQELYDSFTGASVSTNNILRIIQALFKYHSETWFTTAE